MLNTVTVEFSSLSLSLSLQFVLYTAAALKLSLINPLMRKQGVNAKQERRLGGGEIKRPTAFFSFFFK